MSILNPQTTWNTTLFGNPLSSYVTSFVIFVILSLVLYVIRVYIIDHLETLTRRTKTNIDDVIPKILKSIRTSVYLYAALYAAVHFLVINSFVEKILTIIFVILLTYQSIICLQITIDFFLDKFESKEKDEGTKYAYRSLGNIGKMLLWFFGIFFVLSNLGVNVTSLIAGLGIGGVAIALALQNILGDLFSSFAIYFDKPFTVGDFIVVGDKMGVVEKIGIKTTRIQALQGEEIVISNKELTSAQIQNFKRMKERRVVFSFGVIYETPQKKLKEIPKIVEGIIKEIKLTRFDRAHFFKFDDSALYFEVVYYVENSDYTVYMNIQQDINLAIKERFEKEDISMAYPTQTVYLTKKN